MGTAVVSTRGESPASITKQDAMTFHEQMHFAELLVTTGFLPSSVKTPAQAVAIIQTGRELGIPPMHALRSIHVIQGKPALSAELQLALFKARGGRAQWMESTAEKATIWLRHPNGDEHTETFTFEDARKAGITSKDGWKNYPKAMCRARAASAGLRAVAPDIIAGLYDPEELGADVGADGEIVVPEAPEPTTVPQPSAETMAAMDEALAALPAEKQARARMKWAQRRDRGVSDAEAREMLATLQARATEGAA